MDVRVVLLFHFLLGGGWTLDATELEVAEVETPDSDAPDSERDRLFHNQLAQRNPSRIAQTSASPSSQGGRIGLLRQAGRHGWGKGSEVRPVVPTPTAAIETSAESNKAAATGSQLVGQKRPALKGGHSPNEPAEARPRVESSGASSSLGHTMPRSRWGILLPARDVPCPPQNSERDPRVESSGASSSLGTPFLQLGGVHCCQFGMRPPQNSGSLLYNTKFALAFGRPPVPMPDCQYQMSPDMGRNPDTLQVILAQVIAAFNKQHEEMRKRVEAAERAATKAIEEKVATEHARIAAEEEAATKVESLQDEHQRALSDLELKYDRALRSKVKSLQDEHQRALSDLELKYDRDLRSRSSGVAHRIQQVEVSLATLQARQDDVASVLEAMNEEPSAESQESELVVAPPNEDVDEVAVDGTQPVGEERFTELAGWEEGDTI